MPFYGNITNRRNQFTYDKIYSSLTEMQLAVSGTVVFNNAPESIKVTKDDGVYTGRYVFIDYDQGNSKSESTQLDQTNFSSLYDATVWQKIITKEGVQYVLIASYEIKEADEINDLLYANNNMPIILSEYYNTPDDLETLSKNKIYKKLLQDGSSKYWLAVENASGNLEAKEIINTKDEGLLYLLYETQELTNNLSVSDQEYKNVLSRWIINNKGGAL